MVHWHRLICTRARRSERLEENMRLNVPVLCTTIKPWGRPTGRDAKTGRRVPRLCTGPCALKTVAPDCSGRTRGTEPADGPVRRALGEKPL
jgi:hypothetical protein